MSLAEIVVTAGGFAAIALLAFYFFGPKKAKEAEVKGGVQEVQITVKGGYTPDVIRVRKGVPLRLIFDRQEASGCTDRVVFPDFQISKTLASFGTTAIEFTPDRSGSFGFACGMNMLHGTLVVEANGSGGEAAEAADLGRDVNEKFAEAVGVGPTLETAMLAQAELSIFGGGVSCPTCVTNIESFGKDLPGVDEVQVNFAAEPVTVEYDPALVTVEQMQRVIQDVGYRVEPRVEPGSQETEDREAAARRAERRDLTRRAAFGAIMTIPVLYAVMVGDFISESWVPDLLDRN